jgi:hypothetical protein
MFLPRMVLRLCLLMGAACTAVAIDRDQPKLRKRRAQAWRGSASALCDSSPWLILPCALPRRPNYFTSKS